MNGNLYSPLHVYTCAGKIQVSLGADRWFDEDTRVSIALEGLNEKVT